ncbi:MAG: hypothetical protein KIT87_21545 [Anaerolineae bacterium]|nr:hypothetical protein [Anaerolineae bacterium]
MYTLPPSAFVFPTTDYQPSEPAGAEGRATASRFNGLADGGLGGGQRGASGGLVSLEGLDSREIQTQIGLTDTTLHDDNLLMAMGKRLFLLPLSSKQAAVSVGETD